MYARKRRKEKKGRMQNAFFPLGCEEEEKLKEKQKKKVFYSENVDCKILQLGKKEYYLIVLDIPQEGKKVK